MSLLKPTFSLNIGALQSTSERPVAGPIEMVVERDMDSPADGLRLTLTERTGIAPGDEVTVSLGHDGNNEAVFSGTVTAVKPTLTGTQIQGLGQLNDLVNYRTAQFFDNKTAGQIAQDLVKQAGLTTGTTDTGPTLPRYAVDQRQSVYSHLRQLAHRLGYELYGNREGQVMFHGLGAGAGLDTGLGGLGGGLGALSLPSGATGLRFGEHLLAAQASQQTVALGQLTVGGESPMSRQGDPTAHWLATESRDYQGSAGSGKPQLLVMDGVARTQDLANRLAAGVKVSCDRNHQLHLRILGQPSIDLGDSLQTSDSPDALINGSGYVRSLRHRFGVETGFTTDLTLVVGGAG